MNAIQPEILVSIDDLQLRYIDALDSQDMQGWLKTFSTSAEANYLCTTSESVQAKRAVALIMDDCRERLEDRVSFVDRIWAGTYQEYQTRHIVQRTRCTRRDSGIYEARTNFIIAFTSEDEGIAELLSTGVYIDQIVFEADNATFLSKQVITDTSVLPHHIVYPL